MGASLADTELDDDSDFSETHEINVTPFIDGILVLLILFMVAAPLSTVDLPVDLPSSTAIPQKKPPKPLYVTIQADLAVAIGEMPVKRLDLVRSLANDRVDVQQLQLALDDSDMSATAAMPDGVKLRNQTLTITSAVNATATQKEPDALTAHGRSSLTYRAQLLLAESVGVQPS